MAIWHAPPPNLERLNALGADSLPGRLGIAFTAIGDDWLRARMPVDLRTKQPWGQLHVGAAVALAETVVSIGAMLTLDPAQHGAVGLEINANHIRPASDGYVHVDARAEHMGRATQIWSFRITDDAGRLVFLGRITIAVASGAGAQPTAPSTNGEATPSASPAKGLIGRVRDVFAHLE